jgi:hypothetical protein
MSLRPGDSTVDAGPIFIVGAPRSGTSLLRNLLNRHPAIGLCDETYFFYYVYGRRRAFGELSDPEARRRVIERYLAISRIQRLRLDLQALVDCLQREGTTYPSFFAALLRFYAGAHQRRRWGEKTPQHALVTEVLHEWYPHCRVIHLVRDPRDVVSSLLQMPWGSRSVLTNTRLWLRCVRAAERSQHRANHLLVRYEQLVADPEAELRRICSFVAEDYCPQLLVAGGTAAVDAWWFERAQAPVTRDRCGAWQQHLTRQQVRAVEWIAGAQMRRLGYEPTGSPPSTAMRLHVTVSEVAAAAAATVRALPRMWYYWLQPTQLAAEEAWIDRQSPGFRDATGPET